MIKHKDILFIINPNSGNKTAINYIKKINDLGFNLSYNVTNNLEELESLFNDNIDKYAVFIVVGGDGTVNESLKYIYDKKDKYFGVLPAGSGNGFSNELGFGGAVDLLIKDILKGDTVDIDIMSVNEEKCINMAGLGFDSFVAHDFQNRKGRGLKNYIISTVKSIFIFKPFFAKLSIDGSIIKGKYQMITIANTRQFGNNAIISPQSKPDDGVFEVILIKPFPIYLYLGFVIKLFLGNLKESKYIQILKVNNSMIIESDFNMYHVDGEPKKHEGKLVIKMLPKKIKVVKTALLNNL